MLFSLEVPFKCWKETRQGLSFSTTFPKASFLLSSENQTLTCKIQTKVQFIPVNLISTIFASKQIVTWKKNDFKQCIISRWAIRGCYMFLIWSLLFLSVFHMNKNVYLNVTAETRWTWKPLHTSWFSHLQQSKLRLQVHLDTRTSQSSD